MPIPMTLTFEPYPLPPLPADRGLLAEALADAIGEVLVLLRDGRAWKAVWVAPAEVAAEERAER